MGLRLSSLSVEDVDEGEDGAEKKTQRSSILNYARKLDDAAATAEAELIVSESGDGGAGEAEKAAQQR